MEESNLLEKLCMFGLTRQEANIYLCLYQSGELTGYEVAKQTGISRSNVYNALSGLTDKGAAYLVEGNTSKYSAVMVDELCDNIIRNLEQEKKYLMQHIPDKKEQEVGYITIEGFQNIMGKVVNMIRGASKRIYISAAGDIIELLEDELLQVLDKKIKLVILTDKAYVKKANLEGGTCYLSTPRENNIRLIIDSTFALTGELTGSKDDTCLYTGQKNFISVFKDTLRNEIKLIQLQGGKS